MATLNVIYKIAADISGLQTGVTRAATAMESLDSKAGLLGRTLTGAFTIGAVVGFTREILNAADVLAKLSDQTGIQAEQLERLDAVAQSSGNSLEEVARGVNQFQKRMETGGKATVQAIEEIGLSIDGLKQMTPDEQFFAIAKGIQSIQDPAEQTRVAMELFGKAGAQLLPTLKADVDALKDSTVKMSNESVKALDDFGDQLGRWWVSSKNILGEFVGLAVRASAAWDQFVINLESGGAVDKKLAEMQKVAMLAQATKNAPTGIASAPLASSPIAAAEAAKLLTDGLAEQSRQAEKDAEALKKAAAALAVYKGVVDDVLVSANGFGDVVDTIDGNVLAGIRYYHERGVALSSLATMYGLTKIQSEELSKQFTFEQSVVDATTKTFGRYNGQMQAALPTVNGLEIVLDDLASTTLPQFNVQLAKSTSSLTQAQKAAAEHAAQLKRNIQSTFDGVATILDNISGKWAEFGAVVARTASTVMSQLSQGNIFGAVVSGITGAFTAIGRLFHNAEKDVNPVRQAFVDAAGGLAQLNQRAHEAGVTLTALLDAKNPEAYKKAIDDLNAAFQFQDDAMKTLDETVKKYGFTLEELGPALQRQSLDKQAQELFQDFKVLTSAGINVDTVLGRMGDSINDFVHNALKTGTEVPAAMQPMLQRMVELGQLTDENGNIITDLGAAGIHFADTMTQGFAKVVDAVQKLTDAITRGLGLAIQNIPQPEVTGTVKWNVEDIPSGPHDMPTGSELIPGVPAFADGGIVNGPTLALVGEAGPEAVIPLDRVGKSGVGGVTVNISHVSVQASESDDPKVVADRFLDALRTQSQLYAGIGTLIDRKLATA